MSRKVSTEHMNTTSFRLSDKALEELKVIKIALGYSTNNSAINGAILYLANNNSQCLEVKRIMELKDRRPKGETPQEFYERECREIEQRELPNTEYIGRKGNK